ncbi:MAG: DUF5667 domain-containing protein [Coriobacteriia bacterium]|nr:DUF5667 domain-containing protein [Coriobacteriia bacterium]
MRSSILADMEGRQAMSTLAVRHVFARAAVAFATLSLGLGATSLAAANSLPGSPLYPFKRAMEEVRVQFSPRAERSDELVDVAKERVREVRELMESEASKEAVETAVEGFGDAAQRALEEEQNPQRQREQARELEEAVSGESERVRKRVEEGVEDAPDTPGGSPGSGPGSGQGGGTENPGSEGGTPEAGTGGEQSGPTDPSGGGKQP